MKPPILRRTPSRATAMAVTLQRGTFFLGLRREQEVFIAAGEIEMVYGSTDAWVAHQVLRVCAGCPREVRG
jgi:hypothetical protein